MNRKTSRSCPVTLAMFEALSKRKNIATALSPARPSRSTCSNAASATARSWIARPVESKTVDSSADRRPSASPAKTAPSSVTSSRCSTPDSTAWTRSPLWLACVQSSQNTRTRANSCDCDLGFPRAVRPHQARMLARAKRALSREDFVTGRHGHDQVGCERLVPACGDIAPSSSAAADSARLSSTSQRSGCRPRAAKVRAAALPLIPAPITAARLGVRTPERLGRQHRSGARPESGDRPGIEDRLERSVRSVREECKPHHGRQAVRGVPRKGRHPLQ